MEDNIESSKDHTQEERQRELALVKECLDIITYRHDGESYPRRKEARVNPNHRLVEVFGIKNVFTDMEPGGFNRITIEKMRDACKMTKGNDKGDWTDLRKRAIRCFDEYMDRKAYVGSVNLAELTQFVTLKLSLCYLFNDAETALSHKDTFDDVVYVGHRINYLWIASKKSSEERPRWADEHRLHKALRRITTAVSPHLTGSFPEEAEKDEAEPISPEENPLNYLLPAYETMWRVVLRCFIEIRLRDAAESAEWLDILANYLQELKNPACMPEAFHRASATGVRPSDIAKEALRLHPPSRHVHREFNDKLYRADIDKCHRQKLLAGDKPLIFCPERWQAICPQERDQRFKVEPGARTGAQTHQLKLSEQQLGFMPFGTTCKANTQETKAFGMKMITMLVAILCNGLGQVWKLADEDSLPEREIPLDSNRAAYEDLMLAKV